MAIDLNSLSQQNLNSEKGKQLISDKINEKEIIEKINDYKKRYPNLDLSFIEATLNKFLSDVFEGRENTTTREERRQLRKARRELRKANRKIRKETREERLQQRLEDAGVENLEKQRTRVGAEIAILFAKLRSNRPETTKFTINGKIIDSITSEPIVGAEVFLGVNPNPFPDVANVDFKDLNPSSAAEKVLTPEELDLLGNISSENYNNLSKSTQIQYAQKLSNYRSELLGNTVTIKIKQLGRLLERGETVKELEGVGLDVNPNNLVYVPVKEFKNPEYDKDKEESPTNLKRITGNPIDPTKDVITGKDGTFTIDVYIPIIPSTQKCTLDVAILSRKSAERDVNDERIPGTGYTPGTFIILNGDKTVKTELGVKTVTTYDAVTKKLKIEYDRAIDEAGAFINNVALNQVEWVLSQRKVSLNKLTNVIKSKLIPLVIGLLLAFGITKITEANRKTCPTPGELENVIRRRNRVTRQLNNIYKTIIANTAIAGAFLILGQLLKGFRLSLDALPFPQAIGTPPAKDFGGLVFSQPYSATARLQRINEKLEELSKTNTDLNKAILTNLIFIIAGTATVVVLLKSIDKLLQECAEEDDLGLEVINQELLDLAEEEEDDGNPIISSTNGFFFSVETDDSNPVGTLKRRRAIAKDARGVTLLKGELSFSSSDQVLIDELIFYIQQNNLKA